MSVEKRIKEKIKKAEVLRDKMLTIENRKHELEHEIKHLDELKKESVENIYKIEDYFTEHYASIKVEPLEVMKDTVVEVLIAHIGKTTFACFSGIVCSAKAHPEDEYVPEIGEAIAKQRLMNKIFEISYGVKF